MKLHFVHRVCVVLCCPTPSPALSSSPPPRLILSIARSPRLFPSKRLRVPRFRREAPPIFSSIFDTRRMARINSPPEFQGRFRPTRSIPRVRIAPHPARIRSLDRALNFRTRERARIN